MVFENDFHFFGGVVQLTATVTASGFAPKSVVYTSSDEDVATVDARGLVPVKSDATGTAAITATSAYDGEVTDTCVVTVG